MRLYGKNPVLERLKTDPGSIKKLYLQKRTDLSDIVRETKKIGMDFESVDKDWMKREAGSVHAQGVVAEVKDFEYASFSALEEECLNKLSVPVFLDGVTDPQNLGSIIRNISCVGGFSLVIPEHNSAEVNETTLRIANGGENYIKIAKVNNIATALQAMKDKGISVAGAVLEDAEEITSASVEFPLAVVVGSEGKGIRPGVLKLVDARLFIPMKGAPISYNVAVAATLFCYEIARKLK
jgi:23S rRNA (guanosine2251-2'-O)-methyltransferase